MAVLSIPIEPNIHKPPPPKMSPRRSRVERSPFFNGKYHGEKEGTKYRPNGGFIVSRFAKLIFLQQLFDNNTKRFLKCQFCSVIFILNEKFDSYM